MQYTVGSLLGWITLVAVLLAAVACLLPWVLTLLFGGTGGLTLAGSLVLASVQAVLLYASLHAVDAGKSFSAL